MTDPVFDMADLFGEDYLYFYADRTGDERSDADTELIWRLLELEPGMEVLDLACGHGRIANRLAARGCHVTGLDATPLFLQRARGDAEAWGVSVDYHHGDVRDLPWASRFDRVVNWFTSFGYFDDSGNRKVISEVARVLRPGGEFILELNNLPWLLRNLQSSVVMEREGNLLVDRNEFDPLTSRVLSRRAVIRDGRHRDLRFFTRTFGFPELRQWLHEAGFSTVAAYGDGGDSLTVHSRRLITVSTH
ncbi:class I SAM-dependent methyltransferase [Amycolatopsis sp. GM8]|uniref:class I SAM-dependent methyltransferase n=1 Tax=Amycolatopsis sp. GM8 TaxID=2896530 RepID=UPI001F2DE405|nr:class I SAM-dependent methyltransferase [Amycolatopsis sp. GM8]